MDKIFSIAIDGPAGAGKSTVARGVAEKTGAMYLDTGAMYRAVGLYFHRLGLLRDTAAIAARCAEPDISVRFVGGVQKMFLGGEDVSLAIRAPEISSAASVVGAIPEVRAHLVALQQEIAKGESVVMDGRDIGTKVLPGATLKVYLTATCEVRALRRYAEMRGKGETPVYHEVLDGIVERDYNDSHRAASPLTRAEDAVYLDTSALTKGESIDAVIGLLEKAAAKV